MSSYSVSRRIRMSLRGCTFKWSLCLLLFEEEYCLSVFGYLIALPFMDRWHREPHEMVERWGVYFDPDSVVFCWGDKSKRFWFPWMWDHCKTEVMRPDGSWVPYVASYLEGKEPDGRLTECHPYTYVLKSGETQSRVATVYAERRTWRWRMFQWLPFRKVRQSIDVRFDDEVGEETGSWKGGCIGCGWDMKPGESLLQTLRRMESEREFK